MDKLVAKTLSGLEEVLEKELVSIGASDTQISKRAVNFGGSEDLLYRSNYMLRTALSILKPIMVFDIRSPKDLYKKASNFRWEELFSVNQTFSVVSVVYSDIYNHTAYPALLLKDAIVDRFRSRYQRRPSVDPRNPDISINCHISQHRVTISLDSSQVPLFKRGYRKSTGKAPVNEVLAAGIIMKSGWNRQTILFDPMCGSGTIPIEAALLSCRIPPGSFRTSFGFMKWPDYNEQLFNKVKAESDAAVIDPPVSIRASDVSPGIMRVARENIRQAGLTDHIRTSVSDFLSSDSGGREYCIIMNPPYGERIETENLSGLYSGIGERLKHGYEGSSAWIISSDSEAMKSIGLKAFQKHILYNGKLKTTLAGFDLYRGSRKKT